MKKRVLYLAAADGLTLAQSGGAGTHMRGVIQGLKENGFEVLPIISGDVNRVIQIPVSSDENTVAKSGYRNVIKSLMPNKIRLGLRDLRTVWKDHRLEKKTIKRILDFAPDFIYERAAYLSNFGSRLAKRLKIPHFIETDGCMVEIISKDYGVFSEYIGNSVEKRKLQNADYVVVMNKLAVNSVAEKFNLDPKKFVVKTLGVEANDFSVNAGNVEMLKHRYNLYGKFVIGFVGAISTYHGVNYLVDAAEIIKDRNPNIVIMIVGWSKEGELLYNKSKRMNIGNIIFTGKVDKTEVADYYSLFNTGVIPDSEQGIYPIKVLEYGLMKVCPLVPDYQVFRELLKPSETGYFFSPQNAASLADTILNISEHSEEVKRCAVNWQNFVKANFMWKDSVEEIVKIVS